jgi:radical SAM superfamily enzyme YgiQ (UPF0313 family)
MNNVLIIVLPYLQQDHSAPSTKLRTWLAMPYGALSVATYTKNVANVKFIDCNTTDFYKLMVADAMHKYKPDIVGFSMTFDYAYNHLGELLELVKRIDPECITVAGGAATISAYRDMLGEQILLDAVCFADGEVPMMELVQATSPMDYLFFSESWITRVSMASGTVPVKLPVTNLDDAISLDYSFINPDNYSLQEEFSPHIDDIPVKKRFYMLTSRGCPYACLTGNTIIHTIKGDFPIKDLVGKENIKVLSRNPFTQEPLYTSAIHIRKIATMAELVRVHFDDGSYIDCTPDHKFKVFKSKNQYIEEDEWAVEAKDLHPKQQVRAVRFEIQKSGRKVVSTRRNIEIYHAKIVYEAIHNVFLTNEDRVHHKDKNPGNDDPLNLTLTDNKNHIPNYHPEVSERMKLDNPVKYLTPEQRVLNAEKLRGKVRTLQQRINYRNSKLGIKNPKFKEGIKHQNKPSRIKELEVNHKVYMVEKLGFKEDVYCMEVPGIDWFYANKVLVHNCKFCYKSRIRDKKMQYASIGMIIEEVKRLINNYGMNILTLCDDQLLFNRKRAKELFRQLIPFNLRVEIYQGTSVDFIDDEMAELMYAAGMRRVMINLESGSQTMLDIMIEKPVHLDKAKETVQILRKHGIWASCIFVMGYPGETDELRKETMDWIKEADPDWCVFNAAIPIRGTVLYDLCIRNGYIKKDKLGKLDYGNYTINVPGYPAEYVKDQIYKMNLEANFVNNRSMRVGNYITAARMFKQVIDGYPEHAFAHWYLARCYSYDKIRKTGLVLDHNLTAWELMHHNPQWAKYAKYFKLGE